MSRRRRVRTPVDRSGAGQATNRIPTSRGPATSRVASGGVGRGPVGRSAAIAGLVALTVIVVVVVGFLVSRGSGVGGQAAGSPSAQPSGAAGSGTASRTCPTAQPPALAAGQKRLVTIETAKGKMVLTIEADLSPIAAGNFVALAACGYYDGVVFHRLVPGFVIQGGDPTGTGSGGPGYEIQDETVTATYSRGTIAMARTAAPNSVGSQFFVVLDDKARSALASANTYQIIGTVTSGMDVADAIAAMPNSGEPNNTALDPLPMTRVTVSTP